MIKYHTLLAVNKDTGISIKDGLCSSFEGYVPDNIHKDITLNKFVIVGCNSEEDFLDAHSDLSAFVDDFPQEMLDIVDDPLNMTHEEARKLGRSDFFRNRFAE